MIISSLFSVKCYIVKIFNLKEGAILKLFGKTLTYFGIVIAVFISLSAYSLYQATVLKENSDTIDKQGVNPSLELVKFGTTIENIRVQMLTSLTFENTEPTVQAAANLNEVPRIHTIFTEEKSEELTAALKQFDTSWQAFEPRVRANIERINQTDWDGAKKGLQDIKPYFEEVQTAFNQILAAQRTDVEQISQNTEKVYKNIILVSLILVISASVLAILLALFFSKQLEKRLNNIVEKVDEIATGNLTSAPLKLTGKDEITLVAQGVNAMEQSLSTLVKEASISSEMMSASAEELHATTEESLHAAEQISDVSASSYKSAETQTMRIEQITKTLESMETSIQVIATNSQHMSETAQQTASKTAVGTQTVATVNTQIGLIAETSKSTEMAVQSLESKSQQISSIVSMITQISNQTNLLALNASIEAARAGEAGKGFAVVADEVRNLAEESRTSAQQIEEMVHEIQRDIQIVMQSIQEEAERVQQGLAKSDEVRTVFVEIETMINTVSADTQQMSHSIIDVSNLGKQILEHLQDVQQLTTKTLTDAAQSKNAAETQLSATEELSAASDALANLAEQLQNTIHHFNVSSS